MLWEAGEAGRFSDGPGSGFGNNRPDHGNRPPMCAGGYSFPVSSMVPLMYFFLRNPELTVHALVFFVIVAVG